MRISHLFYADDAIFIGEWKKENFINIALSLFCSVSILHPALKLTSKSLK